jgi:hypothetical protein
MYVKVTLKHWTEGSGWEMFESLFNVVQARIKEVVSAAFTSLSLAMKAQRWTTNLGLAYMFI